MPLPGPVTGRWLSRDGKATEPQLHERIQVVLVHNPNSVEEGRKEVYLESIRKATGKRVAYIKVPVYENGDRECGAVSWTEGTRLDSKDLSEPDRIRFNPVNKASNNATILTGSLPVVACTIETR